MSNFGGIGHNSGVLSSDERQQLIQKWEQAEARVQMYRTKAEDERRRREDLQRQIARRDERDQCEDVILDSPMPGPAKLASIRIIKSLRLDDQVEVSRTLLAKAASIKSGPHMSVVLKPLIDHNILQQTPLSGGKMAYGIPSLADLQTAVESYARSLTPTNAENRMYATANMQKGASTVQRTCAPSQVRPAEHAASTVQRTCAPSASTVQRTCTPSQVRSSEHSGGDYRGGEILRSPLTSEYAEPSLLADAKKIASTQNRGSRIPDDWRLSDELRAWVRKKFPLVPTAQVEDEAENFHTYWLAEGSAKARKLDWDKAFQVWGHRNFKRLVADQLRQQRNGRPAPTATRVAVWWREPAKVRQITEAQWRGSIAKHANGTWDVQKLGPPPGHHECVIPRALIDELRLTEIYDQYGHKRGARP